MTTAAPRSISVARSEARVLGVLLCAWLVPWALLSVAAWVAGGRPSASPWTFVNPARIAAHYRADGDAVVLWHLVETRREPNQQCFWAMLALTLIAPAAAAGLHALRPARAPRAAARRLLGRMAPNRTSRWARWSDLGHLRVRRARSGAFILGRRHRALIATEAETSVLVVGPTRSGKTSGIVIPNLFEWLGPAIVTSTKSELVDITGAHRQSIGPVYVYDPTGEIGERYRSVTWSPINGCDDLDHAWRVASWLCAGLQQGNTKGDNDWAHWAESGKLLIAPLLYVAARTDRSIVDVCEWIHRFDLDTPVSALEDFVLDESGGQRTDCERALSMLLAVDQRPDKERGTVFSTVMRIFGVFNENAVARSALTSRFNADEFLKRRGTLYLCTPRQSPERVASLFVGILMTVVTAAYGIAGRMPLGRLQTELGLFLDELANVVPIEDLPALASQGAGRGVVLMSIVQDLSQLRTRYGADRANSILNNHGCKVILPGISDPETADVVARMIGRTNLTDVQVNRAADGSSSRSYTVRQEQLATPDMLRQLHDGSAIVLHRGSPPLMVHVHPWFRDRRCRKRARRRFLSNADYAGARISDTL